MYAGTNYITNGINSFKSVKKIAKKVKEFSSNTKIVFLTLITRKDKRDLDKEVQDVNTRLKKYSAQMNIDYIENKNIKEEQ